MQPHVKEEAEKLVKALPKDTTLDDLMYEIYVLQKIEEGIEAAADGWVLSNKEVRSRFGLK